MNRAGGQGFMQLVQRGIDGVIQILIKDPYRIADPRGRGRRREGGRRGGGGGGRRRTLGGLEKPQVRQKARDMGVI